VKDPIDRAKINVALLKGMRAQEEWQLKWGDIDFHQEILAVCDSKSGEGRHIPINANLLQVLRSLPRRLDNPYVFYGRKTGERVMDKPKNWEKWLAEANIQDFHWHDLRHTFASRLVMKGANLYDVQKLLGHKTIEMTMRYAHLSPDHLKKALNLLVPANQDAARKTGSE
jgi:integrase